ncbi:polyprenyl synthetase family protein [Candidatus Woesearchaeota archaeon]|nr:polyprenyl synthetase family protein [Candidatus Woesearchaeota archaeon]
MGGAPRELGAYIQKQRALIDHAIDTYVRPDEAKLSEAISSALYPGEGHRYRGLIAGEVYRMLGGNAETFLPSVVAIEALHCCSLIFDDLPCMDNSPLRRGKPTIHQRFGEATAVLAGLYLLTKGQAVILKNAYEHDIGRENVMNITLLLESTLERMIYGQFLDLQRGKNDAALAKAMGSKNDLFHFSCVLPWYLLGEHKKQSVSSDLGAVLDEIGSQLAIAYQLFDDLRDVEGDPLITGKPQGVDEETYVHRWGIDAVKEALSRKRDDILTTVRTMDRHSRLEELIYYILTIPS